MNWDEERSTIITGLDLGTTKICAVVAEQTAERPLRIIGMGQHPSEGMQRGAVMDAEKTVYAIGEAIRQAELMAGVEIDSVYAGISGEYIVAGSEHRTAPEFSLPPAWSKCRSTARCCTFCPKNLSSMASGAFSIPWVCMACA